MISSPQKPTDPIHWLSLHSSLHVFDPEWHPISMTSPSRVIQAPSGGVICLQPRAKGRHAVFVYTKYKGPFVMVCLPRTCSKKFDCDVIALKLTSTLCPTLVITWSCLTSLLNSAMFPEMTSRALAMERRDAELKLQRLMLRRWPWSAVKVREEREGQFFRKLSEEINWRFCTLIVCSSQSLIGWTEIKILFRRIKEILFGTVFGYKIHPFYAMYFVHCCS